MRFDCVIILYDKLWVICDFATNLKKTKSFFSKKEKATKSFFTRKKIMAKSVV